MFRLPRPFLTHFPEPVVLLVDKILSCSQPLRFPLGSTQEKNLGVKINGKLWKPYSTMNTVIFYNKFT